MSTIQEKWKANQAKVSHAKAFPGLLPAWESSTGKTIKQVIPLDKHPATVLIMEDNTFAVASRLDPLPAEILEGLRIAKPVLGTVYPEAYRELERRAALDKELTRRSRKENILGAIKNNLPHIPELKKEIADLLSRLPDS
jgi:hypothetical protein